jgi:hypothetical protein
MARSLKLSKTVKDAEGSGAEASRVKVGKIGATSITGNQIRVSFRTGGSTYTGWIVKQVSARRFKCTDGTRTAICELVSSVTNNGDMSITATRSTSATFTVEKITNKRVTDFSGNVYAWNFTTAAAAVELNALTGLSSLEVVTIASA